MQIWAFFVFSSLFLLLLLLTLRFAKVTHSNCLLFQRYRRVHNYTNENKSYNWAKRGLLMCFLYAFTLEYNKHHRRKKRRKNKLNEDMHKTRKQQKRMSVKVWYVCLSFMKFLIKMKKKEKKICYIGHKKKSKIK